MGVHVKSTMLEPDLTQCDCPNAYVITQQYSSSTFISLLLHYPKEKFDAPLKKFCNFTVFFLKIIQCVRKVAVHLQKVLEVMSTSICTGLNPFNFIHKHFLQICV
jgi:hypothetical protein